jgi:hypothetical protein
VPKQRGGLRATIRLLLVGFLLLRLSYLACFGLLKVHGIEIEDGDGEVPMSTCLLTWLIGRISLNNPRRLRLCSTCHVGRYN